jgi:hypothetical protein
MLIVPLTEKKPPLTERRYRQIAGKAYFRCDE